MPSLYPSSVTSMKMPCIFVQSKGPLSTSGIGIITLSPKEASSKRLLVFIIDSAYCWRPLFAWILALAIEFTNGVRSGGVLMAGLSILQLSCSTKLMSGGAVLDSMDSFHHIVMNLCHHCNCAIICVIIVIWFIIQFVWLKHKIHQVFFTL